jgi:hypothetical protein
MLIDYSRDASVKEAVFKTFDGKHPCPLCQAIDAGKKSEQKKDSSPLQKLEFPLSAEMWVWSVPASFPSPAFLTPFLKDARSEPPTPPPRLLPS